MYAEGSKVRQNLGIYDYDLMALILIAFCLVHGVQKSQKKSLSTLRTKRATFTF